MLPLALSQLLSPLLLHLREDIISALLKLLIKMYSYIIYLHLILKKKKILLAVIQKSAMSGKGKLVSTSKGTSHKKHEKWGLLTYV